MKQLSASQQKDITNNFLHKLGAKAKLTRRTQRMYEPPSFDPLTFNQQYQTHFNTYETEIVEMELPLSSLEKLADDVNNIEELRARYGPNIDQMGNAIMVEDYNLRRERNIRSQNPGVQKAWERYQTMLKIAGG